VSIITVNLGKSFAISSARWYHAATKAGLRCAHAARLPKMTELARNSDKSKQDQISEVVRDFVKNLSKEHRLLVDLKVQLYGGTWEPMLDDLRNRLAGKPYIFRLATRIQDDIERIERMQEFEAEHNIDLADYIDL
jgi:hypothetical protein